MLTLLDAGLATVYKINPIISLWDDMLYYRENVQDVLLCEHQSVLGIKLILSDKKLNSFCVFSSGEVQKMLGSK